MVSDFGFCAAKWVAHSSIISPAPMNSTFWSAMRVEDALRQAHRGGRHRHAVGADLGGAAHFLGHREGALEHLVQVGAQAAGFVGRAHRVLHLAEDLRLAQHHRIEPGGDAERMAHRVVLRQHVQVRAQFGVGQLVVVGQEMGGGVERIDAAALAGRIQLGAVAGREDGRFVRMPRAHHGRRTRRAPHATA